MRVKTTGLLAGAIAGLVFAKGAHAAIVNLNLVLDQAVVDPINGDSDS